MKRSGPSGAGAAAGPAGEGAGPSDARDATLARLAARAPEATVCPSEVARAMAVPRNAGEPVDWRATMPEVHAAVDGLLAEGRIQISWKGRRLATRAGPYRISRATGD